MKKLPSHKSLRPTSAKVREALFNILRDKVRGASFLDLYAGTGAIGIDALRLGAEEVVFVEAGRDYAEDIKQKLTALRLSDKSLVITKKVLACLSDRELKGRVFDIIFLDPPYHTAEITEALNMLGQIRLLAKGGVLVAEHFVKKNLPAEFGRLRLLRDYRYGDTVLTLYKEADNE
ncbi:MAG: 16S rRNA (guanine(966)-N(2))-methyltransferase RsmD [Nitrospirae bacterium]|nr:16S rRNA (guanine(966)-N(2))-methyltransferase RsmD [Nitrospirota bacterium]